MTCDEKDVQAGELGLRRDGASLVLCNVSKGGEKQMSHPARWKAEAAVAPATQTHRGHTGFHGIGLFTWKWFD